MLVLFTRNVTWYDLRFHEGEIVDLDNGIANRLLRAGAIVPAPQTEEKKEEAIEFTINDKDEPSPEDSGVSEPPNDSVGKNAPKRRADRRDK